MCCVWAGCKYFFSPTKFLPAQGIFLAFCEKQELSQNLWHSPCGLSLVLFIKKTSSDVSWGSGDYTPMQITEIILSLLYAMLLWVSIDSFFSITNLKLYHCPEGALWICFFKVLCFSFELPSPCLSVLRTLVLFCSTRENRSCRLGLAPGPTWCRLSLEDSKHKKVILRKTLSFLIANIHFTHLIMKIKAVPCPNLHEDSNSFGHFWLLGTQFLLPLPSPFSVPNPP